MQSETLKISPIRMVDLVSQYRDIEKEVDQDIKDVIESAAFHLTARLLRSGWDKFKYCPTFAQILRLSSKYCD